MCISQQRWIPAGSCLGGWQGVSWAGISPLLWSFPQTEDLSCTCSGWGSPLDRKREDVVAALSFTSSGPSAPAGILFHQETGGSCSTRGLSLCCLSTTGFAVPAFLTFLPSWGMFPKMVLLLLLLCSKAVHGSRCSGIQAGPALLSGHLPLGPSWHSFSSSCIQEEDPAKLGPLPARSPHASPCTCHLGRMRASASSPVPPT